MLVHTYSDKYLKNTEPLSNDQSKIKGCFNNLYYSMMHCSWLRPIGKASLINVVCFMWLLIDSIHCRHHLTYTILYVRNRFVKSFALNGFPMSTRNNVLALIKCMAFCTFGTIFIWFIIQWIYRKICILFQIELYACFL